MSNRGIEEERIWFKKNEGRRHLRSGGIPGFPEDGVKGRWMIQVKSTKHKSIALKRKDLEAVFENAACHRKHPMVVVLFPGADRKTYEMHCNEWAIVPLEFFGNERLWEEKEGSGDAKRR